MEARKKRLGRVGDTKRPKREVRRREEEINDGGEEDGGLDG